MIRGVHVQDEGRRSEGGVEDLDNSANLPGNLLQPNAGDVLIAETNVDGHHHIHSYIGATIRRMEKHSHEFGLLIGYGAPWLQGGADFIQPYVHTWSGLELEADLFSKRKNLSDLDSSVLVCIRQSAEDTEGSHVGIWSVVRLHSLDARLKRIRYALQGTLEWDRTSTLATTPWRNVVDSVLPLLRRPRDWKSVVAPDLPTMSLHYPANELVEGRPKIVCHVAHNDSPLWWREGNWFDVGDPPCLPKIWNLRREPSVTYRPCGCGIGLRFEELIYRIEQSAAVLYRPVPFDLATNQRITGHGRFAHSALQTTGSVPRLSPEFFGEIPLRHRSSIAEAA
jgi:hypothetical protein